MWCACVRACACTHTYIYAYTGPALAHRVSGPWGTGSVGDSVGEGSAPACGACLKPDEAHAAGLATLRASAMPPPQPVTNLHVKAISDTTVLLAWTLAPPAPNRALPSHLVLRARRKMGGAAAGWPPALMLAPPPCVGLLKPGCLRGRCLARVCIRVDASLRVWQQRPGT